MLEAALEIFKKVKMRFYFFVFCIMFSVSYCQAEIKQIKDVKDVFESLERADEKTLVIFDVDMVLVQPSDPAFQMANIKRHSAIVKKVMSEIPADQQMVFLSLMTVHSNPILIDERIPQLIRQLTQKGVPAMALTANLTGRLGCIENMEQWRIGQLARLGIDFSQSAPRKAPLLFDNLSSYRGNYSRYLDGVLFVNGTTVSKGEAFLSFLNKTGFRPNRVVFVDDREDNLKSLGMAINMLEYPVQYQGFHYLGALEYPSDEMNENQFRSSWETLASQAKEESISR